MPNIIPASELIVNSDGTIFHLHLHPDNLADKVILVGDPGRTEMVSAHFDKIESTAQNREFKSVTGTYKGKRITVQSTGIGCDNIDIVMTELDALANINLQTRTVNPTHRKLTVVRVGTCGGLQPDTPEGTFVASVKSIGFDGLLNFYAGRNEVCDLDLEHEFKMEINWNPQLGNPYVSSASTELIERIAGADMVRGITIACGGFYGPQGRQVRIPLADPTLNSRIEKFAYKGLHITNFEMESSAVAGMASLLGHDAMTCCMVIANRLAHRAETNYKNSIDGLITLVLDRI